MPRRVQCPRWSIGWNILGSLRGGWRSPESGRADFYPTAPSWPHRAAADGREADGQQRDALEGSGTTEIGREPAQWPPSATVFSQTTRRNDIHQTSDAAQSIVTARQNERPREWGEAKVFWTISILAR
jgi:hypothetical protein